MEPVTFASDLGPCRASNFGKNFDDWLKWDKTLGSLANSTVYGKYDYKRHHHIIYAKRSDRCKFVIFDEPVDVTDQYMLVMYYYKTEQKFRKLTTQEINKLFYLFL